MKLPKTVYIAGVTYQIKKNSKDWGGKFDAGKQIIWIGTKGKNDFQLGVLLHEVLEAILAERNLRFKLNSFEDNEHYRFFFTHDEFDNVCLDLALALKDVIK